LGTPLNEPYKNSATVHVWLCKTERPESRDVVNYTGHSVKRMPPPHHIFIMVALCNTADHHISILMLWPPYVIGGHYIFARWFLSSIYLSIFFPRLISAAEIGCLPYFHTWCGLSANLECMSEMCGTRLAANTGRKISPFWHHRTTLSGCIFAAKACIDNRKKIVAH